MNDPQLHLLLSRITELTARAEPIERVRDWLDNAGFPADTTSMYARGYNDAMNDARRALQGESDV